MIFYTYDEKTKEYAGTQNGVIDLEETKKQGKNVYLLPRNATYIKPPKTEENQAVIFNGDEWEVVSDYRGKTYYIGTEQHEIKELGELPNGAIFEPVELKKTIDEDHSNEINGVEMNKYDKPKAKLFELRDVFCFANAEKAREYIGKDCYFGSSLEDLAHSVEKNYIRFKLHSIDLDRDDAKVFVVDTGVDFEVASFCLPKKKVIRQDAKYRPFKNLDELADYFGTSVSYLVGKILHYKDKENSQEYISMISDVSLFDNRITLKGWNFSLKDLFNNFELWNGEKWIPFGVLEK